MRSTVSARDLVWGYAAQLLNLAAGVLLLPLLAHHAPPEVVGLWMVFVTLVALAQLIELGLQPTIARAVAYAHAGVTRLQSQGIASVAPEQPASGATMLALQLAGKRVYRYAALLAGTLLLAGGTIYIEWILGKNPAARNSDVHLAWMLYGAGTILNAYFGYYTAFIQGRGDVTQGNQVVVVGKLAFLALGAAFIVHGDGLLGLGVAAAVSAIAGRLLARHFYRRGVVADDACVPDPRLHWSTLLPNASRLIAVQLGAFLILRANVLIAANYLSLPEVASYGVTVQVFMVLSGLASLMMNLQMPRMNACQARGDKRALKPLLGSAVLLSWLVYWIGATVFIVSGDPILQTLGKGTRLLPHGPLIALAVIFFLEMNHSVFAGYLTTLNRVPFVSAAVLSGAGTVLLALLLCGVFGMGLWGLVLAQGLVQAAYNNWKWPHEAMRDIGTGLWSLMRSGGASVLRLRAR